MPTSTAPPRPPTPAGGTVSITSLEPGQLTARCGELLAVAVAAFTAAPWNETPAQAAAAALRLIADADESGHLAVLASIDRQACGFAYGVNARRLEQLATRTGTSATTPFELRELAVDPRWRGVGIGARMHDALIAARPARPRYLSTHPAARPALALYRARGWRPAALITLDDAAARIVMHRPR